MRSPFFNVCVVVQFYPWFKFYFPLFLGMVMYDNEFETKENNIRINENIEYTHTLNAHFSLTIYCFSEKYFAGIVT